MKAYYKNRNKEFSNYLKSDYKNITDLNILIPILKDLDYPFIASEWYNLIDICALNPFGKYISKMNLLSYRDFKYSDSSHFNNFHFNNRFYKRLKEDVDKKIYCELICHNINKDFKPDKVVYTLNEDGTYNVEVSVRVMNDTGEEMNAILKYCTFYPWFDYDIVFNLNLDEKETLYKFTKNIR